MSKFEKLIRKTYLSLGYEIEKGSFIFNKNNENYQFRLIIKQNFDRVELYNNKEEFLGTYPYSLAEMTFPIKEKKRKIKLQIVERCIEHIKELDDE